ncbi:hypothetical protein J6590_010283 [Homalodisca vitripennis]|nr:hypothetical protein J6590_010283 [Homalodisca vitripennis]
MSAALATGARSHLLFPPTFRFKLWTVLLLINGRSSSEVSYNRLDFARLDKITWRRDNGATVAVQSVPERSNARRLIWAWSLQARVNFFSKRASSAKRCAAGKHRCGTRRSMIDSYFCGVAEIVIKTYLNNLLVILSPTGLQNKATHQLNGRRDSAITLSTRPLDFDLCLRMGRGLR